VYIKENTKELITGADKAAEIARAILNNRPAEEQHKEYFYMIGLDVKNRLNIIDLISIGTVNSAAIYVREVAKTAILKDCTGVIVFHNHPSGDTIPSQEDISMTNKLKQALELLDITLLDHIIIGTDYKSLKEMALL